MEFQAKIAIWLQIARQIAARIVAGEWKPGDRIPSVRDLASEIQVNPNTVVRSFIYLNEEGIIYNQRGVGYFISEDGRGKALQLQKNAFLNELAPVFFQAMDELGINLEEIKDLYHQHKNLKV